MQFGITIPLQKHLKIKTIPYGEPADLFYCWELHVVRVQGGNTLVSVNASNRFAIILWPMNAVQWNELELVMQNGIKEGFRLAGYTQKQIDTYFAQAGEINTTKTHGRSPVATLNVVVDRLQYLPARMNPGELYQVVHSDFVNKEICRASGFRDSGYPIEFLVEDMRRTGII